MSGPVAPLWAQLRALLYLRSRLFANQFFRGVRRWQGVLAVVLALLVAAGALAGFVGAIGAGATLLADARPEVVGMVWHGLLAAFFLFWLIGLLSEIQRDEAIDLRRLLHLPVSLRQAFGVNFAISLACPSILVFVPAMVGLSIGLALDRGPLLLLAIPAVGAIVLAMAAWTYALQGRLAMLLEDKRRKRTVLLAVLLAILIPSQLPALVILAAEGPGHENETAPSEPDAKRAQEARREQERARDAAFVAVFEGAEAVVPLGWPGLAARKLAAGAPATALLVTLGGLLLAAWGLERGWRATWRHYTASEPSAPTRAAPRASAPERPGLVALEVPGLPGDVAAVALASLRMLLREPRLKFGLFALFFPGAMLFIQGRTVAASMIHAVGPSAVTSLAILGFLPFMLNTFGADRDGFRALVLSPVPRTRILLGKNLALLPVVLGLGGCLLLAASYLLGLPFAAITTGVIDLFIAHVVFCGAGNFASILLPFPLSTSLTARTKTTPIQLLAGFAYLFLLPLLLVPLALPALAGWAAATLPLGVPPAPLVALVVLVLTGVGYAAALPAAGELLERREMRVLEALTKGGAE